MKKSAIISIFSLSAIVMFSCNEVKRHPGKVYMPDMSESRAYETYADHSNLAAKNIHFNNRPVEGTVMRGEELPYHLKNDSTGYAQSASFASPIPTMNEKQMEEAARLYAVNCGVCHGNALDGNGPLYKDGQGPYPVKPATLAGDAKIEALPVGTVFHVITYGKNLMGSYASQLSSKQRWMVAEYVKSKQSKATPADATASVK